MYAGSWQAWVLKVKPMLVRSPRSFLGQQMLSRFFFKTVQIRKTPRPWKLESMLLLFHYVSHLPNHSTTFLSSSSQAVHWSAEIQTKVYDSWKEGMTDRLSVRRSEWIRARSLKFFFAFCKLAVKRRLSKQHVRKTHLFSLWHVYFFTVFCAILYIWKT